MAVRASNGSNPAALRDATLTLIDAFRQAPKSHQWPSCRRQSFRSHQMRPAFRPNVNFTSGLNWHPGRITSPARFRVLSRRSRDVALERIEGAKEKLIDWRRGETNVNRADDLIFSRCLDMALLKKELFVCDHCGERKRLSRSRRHWCENPSHPSVIEMRPARVPRKDKGSNPANWKR